MKGRKNIMPKQVFEHESVLLQESVSGLNLSEGDTVLDATLGLGGHSEALAAVVGPKGQVLGIDADENALERAKARLESAPSRMVLVKGNFRDMDTLAKEAGIDAVQGVLFDLGWNATQLASGRGFSFKSDDPLLMTLDAHPGPDTLTAKQIVNEWSEADLREIIGALGEERFAGRIAHTIVLRRRVEPFERADDLAETIAQAVPPWYRTGRTHPATKTFQALRMMVNDELSSLTAALEKAFALVTPGGRIAVITFHSLEDGLVKRIFKKHAQDGLAELITKKPIAPSREEVVHNPRARSAKLRIIEKK